MNEMSILIFVDVHTLTGLVTVLVRYLVLELGPVLIIRSLVRCRAARPRGHSRTCGTLVRMRICRILAVVQSCLATLQGAANSGFAHAAGPATKL